jgi:RNA polymerase-binding transcription factor DksA
MAAASKKATAKKAAAPKKGSTKKATAERASTTTSKRVPATSATATKTTAKKPPAKKAAAKKSATKATGTATAKKSAAKKTAAKKTAAKKTAAKKSAPKPAAKKTSATKTSAKKTSAKIPTTSTSTHEKSTTTKMATTPKNATPGIEELPKPRFNKDGFGYTKDFDLSFVKQMHDALQDERVRLTGQAKRLEDEAHQLVEEAEMGDVQFDDEGGEGDTMVVERERDLALSAQAREAVTEIDAALDRIKAGTFGYSVVSGRPIPKERLEAIPWASVLVEEKVGGIGRR